MTEQNIIPLIQRPSRISTSQQVANTYLIKVWEDIGEPMDWVEELDIINSASELDTIILDICSDGGMLDTAMLFNRALRSTAAHTIAIIGPSAASAASVFALSCQERILDETSSLMAHTSSYRIGGKDTDILEHANFSRKQLRSLYESVYSGFLTPEEIEDVIKGTPFYFDAEQLEERLNKLSEFRQAQDYQRECLHSEIEETGESFNLLDEINSRVEDGVNKALDKLMKKYNLTEKKKVKQRKLEQLVTESPPECFDGEKV